MQNFFDQPFLVPAVIILAFALDMALGDPPRLPHPVRWIGASITALEAVLRRFANSPGRKRIAGAVLVLVVVGLVYGVALAALYLAWTLSPLLFFLVSAYIVWTSISIKSLKGEAVSVTDALERGELEEARLKLARIVGRDTEELGAEEVMKAAVETVSESTSDGIVAPLFYFLLGGPALMAAYKAVNTLDSMVGYRNERYVDFGWAGARLDDIANYVPARLTSLLMVCASFILGYNWKRAFTTLVTEGRKHASPNSGMPEAAVAGALGLVLGGPASYGREFYDKPFIDGVKGGPGAAMSARSVKESIRIMLCTASLMLILTSALAPLLSAAL